MLLITSDDSAHCPYRDCLGIDTSSGRVTWYQLLAVDQQASNLQMRHRYGQRRALAQKNQRETRSSVWETILQELDEALACLTTPRRKTEYDALLAQESRARLSRQQADARPPAEAEPAPTEQCSHPPDIESARGRFEPLRRIGRGQHGTRVFEAYELTLGRTVAVKCLERRARTPERCRSFITEARFLGSISHPNIVEVHTVNDKNYWIVMELLGNSVRDQLGVNRKGACAPEQVTEFLRQSLSAIHAIHERGVTHGYLSVESFRAAESGAIKLADAPGSTKEGQFRAPGPRQLCVAPELLSPETFGEPDSAVDLYMLGYIAVQLLAGDQLLRWLPRVSSTDRASQEQWLRWHASPLEQLPALEELVSGISPQLAQVIHKLCEKQVADRYSNARDALKDLAPAVSHSNGPTSAASPVAGHARSDSAPAIEHRGGGAPCVVDAKQKVDGQPDFVTTLLDHQLLWNAMRTHRGLQVACTVTIALVLFVMFFAGDQSTAIAEAPSVAVAAEPTAKRGRKQPRSTAAPREMAPDLQRAPEPPIAPRPVEIVDLRSEPVWLPPARSQPKEQNVVTTQVALLPDSARTFAVRGVVDSEVRELFRQTLNQLSQARTSQEWEELLASARKLAPDDPRPLLVYAAQHGFSRRTHAQLKEAILLGNAQYTQPLRKYVEAQLRGPLPSRKVADEVLQQLINLSEQLTPVHIDHETTFVWEWIGCVVGYIERQSVHSPAFRSMLERHLPRIRDRHDSDTVASIDRGRTWVAGQSDSAADALFPLTPALEIGLCLKTLKDDSRSDDSPRLPTRDTAVAAADQ